MNKNEAIEKLEKCGQEHLLKFYDQLDDLGKKELLSDIDVLDIEFINSLYQNLVVNKKESISGELSNIKSQNINDLSSDEKNELYNLGLEKIKEGKVACLLVAGGQGSRLGFEGPKGAFKLPLPSNKALFQIQGERLFNISKRANRPIYWYIMTSPQNNDDTVKFFEDNNYFNLDKSYVKFFKQGVFPSVDENGKILLRSKSSISKNANGSGGVFTSLKDYGYIDEMKKNGIEYVFFYGVDNILVRICDPYLIGYAVKTGFDITSKSVPKKNPDEKVGVFVYRDKKPSIIEYIEMTDELKNKRDENGKLLYGSGNILTHVFKVDFLEKALKGDPIYYDQHKKVDYLDDNGNLVKPTTENAHKFEGLYFDLFKMADDMAILDINREEEFAPVKNKDGIDSAISSSQMFLDLNKKWLKKLGVQLKEDEIVEISPTLMIYGDELSKEEVEKLLEDEDSKVNSVAKILK